MLWPGPRGPSQYFFLTVHWNVNILLFHVLILYPDAPPQQVDLAWAESSIMVAQTKPPLKLPPLVLCHSDGKLTVFYPKAFLWSKAKSSCSH